MRRYLGPCLTFAAITGLAIGCTGLGAADTGVGGGESASGTGGVVVGAAGGATAGVGGGPIETSDGTVAVKVSPPDFAACLATDFHPDPIFLSAPHARAMVSATQVRGILLNNLPDDPAPQPGNVRGAELLGYYHIDYPVAPSDDITVVADLVKTDVDKQLLLQVGVQAPKVMLTKSKEQRRRTSLTILVDTSKSMEGESMLRANAAVLALASSLNKDDILNLVTTNSEVAVVHRIAASTGGLALLQLDPPLQIGGAGSLQTGVDRAYVAATTDESLLPSGLNRLVVITDGGGLADAIAPGPLRGQWTSNRIQLVGVGVGNAKSYRNEVLGAATDAGHGANIYLDSVKEAIPALHDRFDEIMDEAGGEVTIGVAVPSLLEMVELDPSGAIVTESQLLKSDLGRGRSMVFRRFVRVCDPDSVALLGLTLDITLAWNDPVTGERKSRVDHIKVGDAVQANSAGGSFPLLKTSAILAFGNALKSLDSARFKDACVKLAAARNALSGTGPSAPVDPELDSILAQIQRHPVMTMANLKCP